MRSNVSARHSDHVQRVAPVTVGFTALRRVREGLARWRSTKGSNTSLSGTQRVVVRVVLAGVAATALAAVGVHPAFADPSQCSTLMPNNPPVSPPPYYGSQLMTWYDGVHNLAVCNDSSTSTGAEYDAKDASGRASNNNYGWAFQCVELIKRYDNDAHNESVGLWKYNAADYWNAANRPSTWYAHTDYTTYMPRAGDIMVWGGDGSAGHVAIITKVTTVSTGQWNVTTAEQNNRGATYHNVASMTEPMYRDLDDFGHWVYTIAANSGRYGMPPYEGVLHYGF